MSRIDKGRSYIGESVVWPQTARLLTPQDDSIHKWT